MAQHTFPALDTNNTFTGSDNFTGGLQINGTVLGNPTGSGAVVLATSPSITTPSIAGGTITGTVNGAGATAISAPTVSVGDNSTNIATTAFVKGQPFIQSISKNITPITVNANTTAQQLMMTAGLSAGAFNSLGAVMGVFAQGQYTTAANATQAQITISYGGILTSNVFVNIPSLAGNYSWILDLKCVTTTTGASGAITIYNVTSGSTTGSATVLNVEQPAVPGVVTIGGINLTAGLTFGVGISFNPASASNSGTQTIMLLSSY